MFYWRFRTLWKRKLSKIELWDRMFNVGILNLFHIGLYLIHYRISRRLLIRTNKIVLWSDVLIWSTRLLATRKSLFKSWEKYSKNLRYWKKLVARSNF